MSFLSGITLFLFHLTSWVVLLAILIPVSIFLWKMIQDLLNNNGGKTMESIDVVREKAVNTFSVKPSVPAEKLEIKQMVEEPHRIEEELEVEPILEQETQEVVELVEEVVENEEATQEELVEEVTPEEVAPETTQERCFDENTQDEVSEVERFFDKGTQEEEQVGIVNESGIIFLDKEAPFIMEPAEEEESVKEEEKSIQKVE